MKPSELRELAEWHDLNAKGWRERAVPLIGPSKDAMLECANGHAQSAAIIRWAADVLEAEPVGFFPVHIAGVGPVTKELIIKPEFGDDNDKQN